jgi:MoaA/NifB/PqqE/SkfB family radical SAM enzyme
MNFYNRKISKIEIEVSSFCNARCPLCPRESHGGDYSFFNQVNLSSTFFEIYFPKQVVAEIKELILCGLVGEPAMNKYLIDIIKWFRNINPDLYIEVYTNGSVQKPEWWFELGTLLGQNGNTIFSIDGLEDTNHIYRKDVKWDRVIDNAKAYIKSGAKSTWQFIPFKHNQHQVEEAEKLSKDMGFTYFKTKISFRDLVTPSDIEPSNDPRFSPQGQKLDFGNMPAVETYLNNLDIDCYAIRDSSVYISAEGLVFPCCHTASVMFINDDYLPKGYDWLRDAKNKLDKDNISLYKNKLDQILISDTFLNIKGSWDKNMNTGRHPLCAALCGRCNGSKNLTDSFKNLER